MLGAESGLGWSANPRPLPHEFVTSEDQEATCPLCASVSLAIWKKGLCLD